MVYEFQIVELDEKGEYFLEYCLVEEELSFGDRCIVESYNIKYGYENDLEILEYTKDVLEGRGMGAALLLGLITQEECYKILTKKKLWMKKQLMGLYY